MALSALTFSSLPWKWITLVSAILGAFLFYGQMRADGREEKVNARWIAAAKELEQESRRSAVTAETKAQARENDFAEQLQEEKERIDEAIDAGSDPFDVLFPGGV